jgi:hypothetical protein
MSRDLIDGLTALAIYFAEARYKWCIPWQSTSISRTPYLIFVKETLHLSWVWVKEADVSYLLLPADSRYCSHARDGQATALMSTELAMREQMPLAPGTPTKEASLKMSYKGLPIDCMFSLLWKDGISVEGWNKWKDGISS